MSHHLWQKFEEETKELRGPCSAELFNYSVHISLKYNYLFTETPKVACSTVKTVLQRMELDDPQFFREEFEDIHHRSFSPLIRPVQIANLDRLLKSSIFKFCFVRNPYSRLLSAYLEKICGNKSQKKAILEALGKSGEDLTQSVSFSEFVQLICNQSDEEMDPHWRPQYQQPFQKGITYDFVGKLESFPEDLHDALSKINRDFAKYLGHEKRHATGAKEHLKKYYTAELIEMVKRLYRDDFEFFGYDINIITC